MSKGDLEAFRRYQELLRRVKERASRIKHVIVVMSGKGGVGKSFITANFAAVLAKRGFTVGILDADMHGPSIPKILGLEDRKLYTNEKGEIVPVEGSLKVKVVSMDFLLPGENVPVIWRGPIKTRAIMQFLAEVDWGDLDFLLIDLPPGTGDEPLTIIQCLGRIAGAVIITIPTEVSQHVVKKAVAFARQLNIPILGIVENMSGFTCPESNRTYYIFGRGGGEKIAKEMNVRFLGSIPIDPRIADSCDKGFLFVMEYTEAPAARKIEEIVDEILKIIETQNS